MIRVLEGKLAKLTQRFPIIRIEQIPSIMQELVVGIPPTWICLMQSVSGVVLVYIEAAKASTTEEAEEDGDQDDQGYQDE